MSDSGSFAEFEQKWFAEFPENRVIAVFLPAHKKIRASAFGCLIHELSDATFHIKEPQVAVAKIGWWAQELSDASHGGARHPITRALFDDPITRESDPALWPALAEGALTQLDRPGAGTMEALLEEFEPFHAAVAKVESALMCDGKGNIDSDAALWTCSHLLHDLPRLARGDMHLPLPLSLLARHGTTRSGLVDATPARAELLRDFLGALEREIAGALGVAAEHSLRQRVRVRLDLALIQKARAAADPLSYLTTESHAGYWRSLCTGWREARAAARQVGA
jgi:15-cis-phytoene synthase